MKACVGRYWTRFAAWGEVTREEICQNPGFPAWRYPRMPYKQAQVNQRSRACGRLLFELKSGKAQRWVLLCMLSRFAWDLLGTWKDPIWIHPVKMLFWVDKTCLRLDVKICERALANSEEILFETWRLKNFDIGWLPGPGVKHHTSDRWYLCHSPPQLRTGRIISRPLPRTALKFCTGAVCKFAASTLAKLTSTSKEIWWKILRLCTPARHPSQNGIGVENLDVIAGVPW